MKDRMRELIETCSLKQGLAVYDVRSHKNLLQVMLEHRGGEGNPRPASLRECEEFLKTLLFLLESDGISPPALEVSSPGLNRPLRTRLHFQKMLGQTIEVFTKIPLPRKEKGKKSQKKHFRGRLLECGEGGLVLCEGQKHWTLPFNQIKTANRVFEGPDRGGKNHTPYPSPKKPGSKK